MGHGVTPAGHVSVFSTLNADGAMPVTELPVQSWHLTDIGADDSIVSGRRPAEALPGPL